MEQLTSQMVTTGSQSSHTNAWLGISESAVIFDENVQHLRHRPSGPDPDLCVKVCIETQSIKMFQESTILLQFKNSLQSNGKCSFHLFCQCCKKKLGKIHG